MLNPLDMTGKTILIAGASAGLGRASAKLLSQLGARLVLVARRAEVLQKLADSLVGGSVVVPFDLMNTEAIPSMIRDVTEKNGTLDGLVHSAAIQRTRSIRSLKGKEFESVMTLGVEAGLALVRGFQQQGVGRDKGGSIVFLSSVSGSVGQPGLAAYCASKGAVESLTRSLACELAVTGVRVNSVAPAQILTGSLKELQKSLTDEQFEAFRSRHPLDFGRPEDVANAIAFLLSDASRWITGTNLVIDGGYLAQ